VSSCARAEGKREGGAEYRGGELCGSRQRDLWSVVKRVVGINNATWSHRWGSTPSGRRPDRRPAIGGGGTATMRLRTMMVCLMTASFAPNFVRDAGASTPHVGCGEEGSAAREVNGDVVIRDADDLAALSCVRRITGSLTIENTWAARLDPLASLTEVGGSLTVRGNSALTSLSGLDSLTTVGGFVSIESNPALTSLSGLEALDTLNKLEITSNPLLTSITGINGIVKCNSSILIAGNEILTDVSNFDALEIVVGYIIIHQNDELTTISGFEALVSVGDGILIEDNGALTSVTGFNSLTRVGGFGLNVTTNRSLTTLSGLNALATVNGTLLIVGESLSSLTGLTSLHIIRDDMIISDTLATSLDNFEKLTDVEGEIFIQNNTELTNVSGMVSLSKVGSLSIVDNGKLCRSDIVTLTARLQVRCHQCRRNKGDCWSTLR
jgi:hypothetical protein